MNLKIATTIRDIINGMPEAIDAQSRDLLVIGSLARAIAIDLPLPTGAVDNVDIHFANTPCAMAMEILSAINEQYVLDTERAMALVRNFYTLRYKLVHEPRYTSAEIAAAMAMDSNSVPADVAEVLNKFEPTAVRNSFDQIIWSLRQDSGSVPAPTATEEVVSSIDARVEGTF